MRSLSLLALICSTSQLISAAQAQTRSAMLSQTAQAQPITIKTTPQFKLDLQHIIEPKTGSPTVSVGSPAMSVTSSVSSEGSTESPLNSGRLTIDSGEKLNPLPEPTASTTTISASISNQIPVTSSLPQNIATVTLMLTAKPEETTARAEAEAKTKRAQAETDSTALSSPGNNHINFGDTDFDPSVREPELIQGAIGYNTAKRYARQEAGSQNAGSEEAWVRFYRNLIHPSPRCVHKSSSSPEGFFEYPCQPRYY